MKQLAASILVCLTAWSAAGADNPNTAKGFQPGRLYQFGELSHVNLFNGNLNLSLPIGQSYTVGGNLSYRFMLAYSGNSWATKSRFHQVCDLVDGNPTNCVDKLFYHNVPTEPSNAGLGWYFSSGGQLLADGVDPQLAEPAWTYRTADGAQHAFNATPASSTPSTNPLYSEGGTYLRLKSTDCDDGTPCRDVEFPDGTTHRFAAVGGIALRGILDRFGNKVSVSIVPPPPVSPSNPPPTPPVWTFSDSAGRIQTVTFERLAVPTRPDSGDEPQYFDVVKSVQLTAFGGTSATYTFHYSPTVNGDNLTLTRRPLITGCACNDNTVNENVWVPLLTGLTLPDGSVYAMTYNPGAGGDSAVSGSISSLTLPTLGKYEWLYQSYQFPSTTIFGQPPPTGGVQNQPDNVNYSAGLQDETKKDAAGMAIQRTHYDTLLNHANLGPEGATTVLNTVKVFASGATQDTLLSRSVHYFAVGPLSGYQHGLPITLDSASNADPALAGEGIANPDTSGGKTRYLSTKTYDGAGNLLTYTYLSYEGSNTQLCFECANVDSTRVFYRNLSDGSLMSSTTDSSDFDGYGHYRSIVTSGNGFSGSTTSRTVSTAYNKADTDVGGTIFDTGTAGTSSAHAIPTDKPWLINMYTSVTTTEGNAVQKSLYSFNTTTGFLNRTRALRDSVPDANGRLEPLANDVVTAVTPDATGNAQLEEYFGGDGASLPTSPLATASLTGRTYALVHEYSAGALSRTSYISPTCTSAPQTACASLLDVVNRTIDGRTGLTTTSSDPSGITTTFGYDTSGRVTSLTAPGTASVADAYHNATDSGYSVPTAVETITSTAADNSSTQKIEYDAFGRVGKETRSIPGGTTSRVTVYDAAGHTKAVTEWETTPSADASVRATKYTYDALGRPLTITAPDHTIRTFSYLGARQVTRRELIGANATAADTVESYDLHGRLASVLDANGTTTDYTYDAGNRLATISVGGQGRNFTYDNLGLLRSETHPENGTTYYGGYDARGHVGSKAVNSANQEFDLTYDYDSSERLRHIYSRNPNAPSTFRLSKEFTYATANPNPYNHAKGKLLTATRYNYELPGGNPVTVTEGFEYVESAGRLTTKTTTIAGIGAASRTIYQGYEYNDLGLLSRLPYPSPQSYGTPTWDNVTPHYTAGRFTGASVTGYYPAQPDFTTGVANGVTYWPNGTVNTVAHNNGVTDTYEVDPTTGMPRPSRITFTQWSSCASPSIATQSAGATIFYGDPKTISVTATGDSLTYQWYAGQTLITGATAATYAVPPTQTGTYWVRVANACGHADSTAIAITVQLRAPIALVADTSGGHISISWQMSTGATSYQVFREWGGAWSLLGNPAASQFTDNNPPSGATLAYRVAAIRTGVLTSDFSNSDIESTLAFTNVTAGMPVTYAVFEELRNGLNALRWASGDPPWSWSQLNTLSCAQAPMVPQVNATIYAAHLHALRCAMDSALVKLGMATTSYTDSNVTGVVIKAVHVRELQQRTDYQGDNR